MKLRIGVIYGGHNTKNRKSIETAIRTIQNLHEDKYEATPIYIAEDNIWYTGNQLKYLSLYDDMALLKRYAKKVNLVKNKNSFYLINSGLVRHQVAELDIILPLGHGRGMEDGDLQGYLKTIGIPYVGSGVTTSALTHNRTLLKKILSTNGLDVINSIELSAYKYKKEKEECLNQIKTLKKPLIIKLTDSSIKFNNKEIPAAKDAPKAIRESFRYYDKIIVEEKISKIRKFNIAIIGNRRTRDISAIEEIKKVNGKNEAILPADITKEEKEQLRKTALKAFECLNIKGLAEFNIFKDASGKLYINKVHTIPYDLSYELWEKVRKKLPDLLDEMINITIEEHQRG